MKKKFSLFKMKHPRNGSVGDLLDKHSRSHILDVYKRMKESMDKVLMTN